MNKIILLFFLILVSSIQISRIESAFANSDKKYYSTQDVFIQQASGEPQDYKNLPNKSTQNLKMMNENEKESILRQFSKCWSAPTEATNIHLKLEVVVYAEFNINGSLKALKISDKNLDRYKSNSLFRKVANSAMHAIRECSPLKNLPPEKYGTWKSMELHFDPREMLQ